MLELNKTIKIPTNFMINMRTSVLKDGNIRKEQVREI